MQEIENEEMRDEEFEEGEIEESSDDIGSILRFILIMGGVAASAVLVIAGFKLLGVETITSEMDKYYDGMGLAAIGFACFIAPLAIALSRRV